MKQSTTSVMLEESTTTLSPSRLLGTVSSDKKRGASQISRSYKQASHFFLQRRFPEALLTIQPLIVPPKHNSTAENGTTMNGRAPVADASRSNRVKVWSLYLTLLNAIVELGADEGKEVFGNATWRAIWSKVRDGSVWAEVVGLGYDGRDGNVDSEVVSNLATLLITHSSTQKITQQRLENYLSASCQPSFDISDRFDNPDQVLFDRPKIARSGTDTPRDLNAKVKVIELYTLHVLPRNEEWQYAKDFVAMSEFLDEDTREEFLQTLGSLETQQQADNEHAAALLREQEAQFARSRQESEKRVAEEAKLRHEVSREQRPGMVHKHSESEKDYGIEESASRGASYTSIDGRSLTPANSRSHVPQPKKPPKRRVPTSGMVGRGTAMLSTLQHLISQMVQSLSQSPAVLLRLVMFIIALLITLGRQDARDALMRVTMASWQKVRGTIGMGVKVSYI